MNKEIILLLDAQAVQTLIIARSLKQNGYSVAILCDSKCNYGYHTRYADYRYIAPSSKNEVEYFEFLVDFLKSHTISAMIPMTDDTASIISKYQSELVNFTAFISPLWSSFQQGYDKNKLISLCYENGIPHPETIDLDINKTIPQDFFPALIKPNITCGGRGMTLVNSLEEFNYSYPVINKKYGSCHLRRFIFPGGRQIKVQIFIDPRDGTYFSSVIHKQRYYPEDGGSSCCNITISNDYLVNMCKKLLDILNWKGFADLDLIENPLTREIKVMELNPRIPACIKSAILSGVDYATIIADVSLNKPLKNYNYVPGQKLRHIGFDVLWFINSKNRFKAKPSWFKFIDKNLSFQDFSWRDPLPFFVGTWNNVKHQLSPSFRKEKSGIRMNINKLSPPPPLKNA